MFHSLATIAAIITFVGRVGAAADNGSNSTQQVGAAASDNESNSTQPVYFSLIYSESKYHSGAIHALDMALEKIEDQQLLPGYKLTYETARKSLCSREESLDAFFQDFVRSSIPKIALVGCGCSKATVPVAEISHQWNITQIAFASTIETLSNRARFKHFFRTAPSSEHYSSAVLELCREFKWKRLAVIYVKNDRYDEAVYEDLKALSKNVSSEVLVESVELDEAKYIFEQNKFHVFFVLVSSSKARQVICEAKQRQLVYPNYGWIFTSNNIKYSWNNSDDIKCANEELREFLWQSHALILNRYPKPLNDSDLTDAGFTAKEFHDNYTNAYNGTEYKQFAAAFDALWTVARVLNYTETLRNTNMSTYENCSDLPGELVPLNEFNYSNAFMGCVMSNSYYEVNFTGVSGPVKYDDNGDIMNKDILLEQLLIDNDALISKPVGYLKFNSSGYQLIERNKSLYPDGAPPDGTPISIINTYHIAVVVVFYALALCGVVLTITIAIFNFVYRKNRIIRLTTPILNNVILSGAFLIYIAVIFCVLPCTTKDIFLWTQCIVYKWMYDIGYLLMHGTILAKMWRIYNIFHNPNTKKYFLKTWYLMCGVAGITAIGAVLLLAETISFKMNKNFRHLVPDLEHPNGTTSAGVLEEYYVWQCYKPDSIVTTFSAIFLIYLGLLHFLGITLAFLTRNVKVAVLNESKSVSIMIYTSTIIMVILTLTQFFSRKYMNISGAVNAGGIIFQATIFLALSFVPKMIDLYRDPKGEKIFSEMTGQGLTNCTQSEEHHNIAVRLTGLTDTEKVSLLTSRVTSLEQKMKDKDKQIAAFQSAITAM